MKTSLFQICRKQAMRVAVVVAVLFAGCSADTPTQATDARDDVIATLVAGASGYESTGLAATVNDLITARTGMPVREAIAGARQSSVVVTRSDSIFDPATDTQLITLACERRRGDASSSWQVQYALHFGDAGSARVGLHHARLAAASSDVDGTYRTAAAMAHGTAHSELRFDDSGAAVTTSGSYRWRGNVIVLSGEHETYNDIEITFTWNGVQAAAGGVLRGRCDVNVRANGPDGVISRNGTLQFTGGDLATLTVGAKHWLVNVRQGETAQRI